MMSHEEMRRWARGSRDDSDASEAMEVADEIIESLLDEVAELRKVEKSRDALLKRIATERRIFHQLQARVAELEKELSSLQRAQS